jgi:CrcB protein
MRSKEAKSRPMRTESRVRAQTASRASPISWSTGGIERLRDYLQRRAWVTTVLVISLGAAVGANLRYGLSIWAAQQWGTTFPYGTLVINILGSFAIGVAMALLTTRLAVSDLWRLLIVTGLLGGFTTFSTFSYETYGLLLDGSWLEAGLNILMSVGIGLLGVFLGAGLARLLP